MDRHVSTSQGLINYNLTRKNIKNMNMRIGRDGIISVSCPLAVPLASVDEFVSLRADWVIASMEKIKTQNIAREKLAANCFNYDDGDILYYLGVKYQLAVVKKSRASVVLSAEQLIVATTDLSDKIKIKKQINKWYARQASAVISSAFDSMAVKHAEKFGENFVLRLRNTKSRWGSCIPKLRTIMLCKRLICYSTDCIEYVALHELAHILVGDHSEKFYQVLSTVSPDYKDKRALLSDAEIRAFVNVLFA